MTVSSVTLTNLRNAKNAVIGNPSAKLELARDPSFVSNVVDCLNFHDARADIRIEAAHVVASLSYGSDEALLSLLRANAPHALLYAITHFHPSESPVIRAAFSRALRALAVSAADAVGPAQWGLGPINSLAEHDARDALEFLFHPDSLDSLLPLLIDPTPQVPISIAQLIAAAVRVRHHRTAIAEWLPPAERTKAKEKDLRPRRGWEKAAVGPGPARLGGWTARQLVLLVGRKNVKLQEAALGALAALAKDSPDVAGALARAVSDRESPSPLTTVLNLTKSRSPDVQLVACLCAAHVLRALPRAQQDEASTRLVMNTVNRMIASPFIPEFDSGGGGYEYGFAAGNLGQVSLAQRTRACFVLYHLVSDDAALCQSAFDRGCLAQLVGLVTALPLPPPPPSFLAEAELGIAALEGRAPGLGRDGGNGREGEKTKVYIPPTEDEPLGERGTEQEWCEPEGRAALREAALTAIAAISLFDNDVRRSLTEPSVHPSYHHPSMFPSSSSTSAAYHYTAPSYTAPFYSPSLPSSIPLPSTQSLFVPPNPTFPPNSTQQPTSSSSSSSFSRTPSPPVGFGAGGATGAPPLLPVLLMGLGHPAPGVRYACCQCVRAMSRAVAVLRTNIVDSGLGVGVWRRCVKGRSGTPRESGGDTNGEKDKEEEGEGEGEQDTRVLNAGLSVICNLVNDFSPLRDVLLEDGLVPRLVGILGYPEPALRVSALWALKNLLYRSTAELKGRVMREVGWGRLVGLVREEGTGGAVGGAGAGEEVREQALHVLRNVTENEGGVEVVYREVGEEALLDVVAGALRSGSDDVVLQAAFLLANLANDTEAPHLARILSHSKVLPALHAALVSATITSPAPTTTVATSSSSSMITPISPISPTTSTLSHTLHTPPHTRTQARGPLVSCVAQLAMAGPAQVKAAGFEGALRHVCEWAGGGLGAGRGAAGGWDDDRQVAEKARGVLRMLERA